MQNADLGIPAIPGGSGSAAGQLTSLLSGSHTMNVWTDGAEKARIAVKDQYAETDVITDGTDVWTYDSRAKKATHTTLPEGDQADRKAPAGAPQTPQQAAQEVLAKLTPTTDVRVDPDVSVAGQDAYDLVLTPKDAASLVKQVRIAVDGANYVPLRVQVFGAGDKPAIDVAYTDVAFGQPSARDVRVQRRRPARRSTRRPSRSARRRPRRRRRSSRPARPRRRRTPPRSAPAGAPWSSPSSRATPPAATRR